LRCPGPFAYLNFIAYAHGKIAFILVIKDAMITETGAAILTIKLIAMPNLVSAFTAFYSPVDKLKHLSLILRNVC
jgi:hypothetical protein